MNLETHCPFCGATLSATGDTHPDGTHDGFADPIALCCCTAADSAASRRMNQQTMSNQETPWHSCEVRFPVTGPNDEARYRLTLCGELPPGWIVGDFETHPRGCCLRFEVQGEALVADGLLVARILRRLGLTHHVTTDGWSLFGGRL